jgi:hypothetical protein
VAYAGFKAVAIAVYAVVITYRPPPFEFLIFFCSLLASCVSAAILYPLLRLPKERVSFLVLLGIIVGVCIGIAVVIVYLIADPTPRPAHGRDDVPTDLLISAIATTSAAAIGAMAVGSVVIVGLTFVAIYALAGLEFILRRIAENPKGPFLMTSAVIGALAGLLKAFG